MYARVLISFATIRASENNLAAKFEKIKCFSFSCGPNQKYWNFLRNIENVRFAIWTKSRSGENHNLRYSQVCKVFGQEMFCFLIFFKLISYFIFLEMLYMVHIFCFCRFGSLLMGKWAWPPRTPLRGLQTQQ